MPAESTLFEPSARPPVSPPSGHIHHNHTNNPCSSHSSPRSAPSSSPPPMIPSAAFIEQRRLCANADSYLSATQSIVSSYTPAMSARSSRSGSNSGTYAATPGCYPGTPASPASPSWSPSPLLSGTTPLSASSSPRFPGGGLVSALPNMFGWLFGGNSSNAQNKATPPLATTSPLCDPEPMPTVQATGSSSSSSSSNSNSSSSTLCDVTNTGGSLKTVVEPGMRPRRSTSTSSNGSLRSASDASGSWLMPSLPEYTGVYPVGIHDIEWAPPAAALPSRESTRGDIPGTVLVRLFYPANLPESSPASALSSTPQQPKWLPEPWAGFVNGYGEFIGVSKLLFRPFMWATMSATKIPAHENVDLVDSDNPAAGHQHQLPVIIFSHGVGGCRSGYSALCGELASHGFVVCAIEHRDGSAAFTTTGGLEYIPRPFRFIQDQVENEQEVRRNQLFMRVNEVRLAIELLKRLNDGQPLVNLLDPATSVMPQSVPKASVSASVSSATGGYERRRASTVSNGVALQAPTHRHLLSQRSMSMPLPERRAGPSPLRVSTNFAASTASASTGGRHFTNGSPNNGVGSSSSSSSSQQLFSQFRGRLVLNNMVAIGHSFGGATILQTMHDLPAAFTAGICLDPWMLPLDVTREQCTKLPVLTINSEPFSQWTDNQVALSWYMANSMENSADSPFIHSLRDASLIQQSSEQQQHQQQPLHSKNTQPTFLPHNPPYQTNPLFIDTSLANNSPTGSPCSTSNCHLASIRSGQSGLVTVIGTGHQNPSDFPLLFKHLFRKSKSLGGPIDPRRAISLINRSVLEFLRNTLPGELTEDVPEDDEIFSVDVAVRPAELLF
ncbi:hypothetical protein GQ42DRAFT_53376 [Ramicandelaber brevisporus]|nr:hypothetical protein GQ42DRAFT_53376 [Ramicandelaber brevisporus]